MPKATRTAVPTALLAVGLAVLAGCSDGAPGKASAARKSILIFHADALATPFEALERAFEKKYPQWDVVREPSGSVMAANKIASLNRNADVIAVADYLVIERILRPTYADWYICFATNEIGIAKSEASKYGNEINADNWFDILTRPGVTFGAGNPNQDPCGYWAELAWKLADLHYKPKESIYERMMKKCPRGSRTADAQQLLPRVQSAGGTDYAWVYKSQADAHHMPFISLPAEVNLSDPADAARYGQVSVELTGKKPGTTRTKHGHPILFAIAALKEPLNPAGAMQWVQFVLSAEGREILEKAFMTVAKPPFTFDLTKVPETLRAGVEEKPKPDAGIAAAR